MPVAADAVVLDLAAGTGKLTRQLVRRFERVIAVEPLAGMRAVLEEIVPEAEALPGTATEIPLEDDAVDAVFVGEAFHWFGNDDAVREIARVLGPRGVLAILFNTAAARVEPPLPQAFRDALDAVALVRAARAHRGERALADAVSRPFRAVHGGRASRMRSRSTARGCSRTSPRGAPSPDCRTRSETQLLERLAALLPEASYRKALRTHLYLTTLSEGG